MRFLLLARDIEKTSPPGNHLELSTPRRTVSSDTRPTTPDQERELMPNDGHLHRETNRRPGINKVGPTFPRAVFSILRFPTRVLFSHFPPFTFSLGVPLPSHFLRVSLFVGSRLRSVHLCSQDSLEYEYNVQGTVVNNCKQYRVSRRSCSGKRNW